MTDDMPEGLESKLDKWASEDDAHWGNWRKSAREAFAFVASDQHSKSERAEMEEAGRLITTINRIGPMVNAVAGAEIIDRQQVQYVPRTTGDVGVNDLLTMGAEWIRDQARADREESDAFRDTLICGLGFTETRMDYDDDPEGRIVIERVDPLEIIPHAGARKSNLTDARRIRRVKRICKDEFEDMYPDATADSNRETVKAGRSGGSRRSAYKTDHWEDNDALGDDEVELHEWQWFEFKTVYLTIDPETGQWFELTPEQHEEGEASGALIDSVKQRRKVFYRAVKCGSQVLEYGKLPDGEFTIKCITGERDRNKGTFYGIVEAMKDPQRFANLFFSMLHHIIRTNAKGGVLAETGAFDDPKKAQESWARSDVMTWVKPGGLDKIRDKPSPNIPPQITQMMQYAVAGIKDASGINEELLGLVERNQPGVLEHQRKQAAYAILAGYYDSLRFYRKEQGGLLLKYMQKYLPDGYLVRIAGEDGDARYVPLTKQPDTIKFDVIVDDAPAGPNQREKVWALMSNMQPMLQNAGPAVWAEMIEYSPFPDKINKALQQVFAQQAAMAQQPPDPMMAMKAQGEFEKARASATRDISAARKDDIESALMMQGNIVPIQPGL